VDGEANDALLKFLSKTFAVPKSQLELVRGEGSRNKRVRILGVREEDAVALLVGP
jgi:uncharacterized protein